MDGDFCIYLDSADDYGFGIIIMKMERNGQKLGRGTRFLKPLMEVGADEMEKAYEQLYHDLRFRPI